MGLVSPRTNLKCNAVQPNTPMVTLDEVAGKLVAFHGASHRS